MVPDLFGQVTLGSEEISRTAHRNKSSTEGKKRQKVRGRNQHWSTQSTPLRGDHNILNPRGENGSEFKIGYSMHLYRRAHHPIRTIEVDGVCEREIERFVAGGRLLHNVLHWVDTSEKATLFVDV